VRLLHACTVPGVFGCTFAPAAFYGLFPGCRDGLLAPPWDALLGAVFRLIQGGDGEGGKVSQPALFFSWNAQDMLSRSGLVPSADTKVHVSGRWLQLAEVVCIPVADDDLDPFCCASDSPTTTLNKTGALSGGNWLAQSGPATLAVSLSLEGQPCCLLPSALAASIRRLCLGATLVSPIHIRNSLRWRPGATHRACSTSDICARHPSVRHAPLVLGLLRYVTSDLRDGSGTLRAAELLGLPLLPLSDGSAAYFCARPSPSQEVVLTALKAMGFDADQCLAALLASRATPGPGDDACAAAATWLLEAVSALDGGKSAVQAVLDDAALKSGPLGLVGASPRFIATTAQRLVLASFVPDALIGPADMIGEDLASIFASDSLQRVSLIREMRSDDVAALLLRCVPHAWITEGNGAQLETGPCGSIEWLRSLWSYLNDCVRDLEPFAATELPLLPTTRGTVSKLAPPSRSITMLPSAAAFSEALPDSLLAALGLWVVDTAPVVLHSAAIAPLAIGGQVAATQHPSSLHASSHGGAPLHQTLHPDLWRWVQPGDWRGLLRGILARARAASEKSSSTISAPMTPAAVSSLFDSVQPSDRNALRLWLAKSVRSEATAPITEEEKALVRALPVFYALHFEPQHPSSSSFSAVQPRAAADFVALGSAAVDVSCAAEYLTLEVLAELQRCSPAATFLQPIEASASASGGWSNDFLALSTFLRLVGVPVLDLADFALQFLLSEEVLSSLPEQLRYSAVAQVLAAAGSGVLGACSRGAEALRVISGLPCIPVIPPLATQPLLKKPCELFDPTVPVLVSLFDTGRFPATSVSEGVFISTTVLVGLRACGMRSTVGRSDILASAHSIDHQQRSALAALSARASCDADIDVALSALQAGISQGAALLKYLQQHSADLLSAVPAPPQSSIAAASGSVNAQLQPQLRASGGGGGFFSRVAAGVAALGHGSRGSIEAPMPVSAGAAYAKSQLTEDTTAEVTAFVAQLRALSWVPAYVLPPIPFLPWLPGEVGPAYLHSCPPLVQPSAVRLVSHAWLISAIAVDGSASMSAASASRLLYNLDDGGTGLARDVEAVVRGAAEHDKETKIHDNMGPMIRGRRVLSFRMPARSSLPDAHILMPVADRLSGGDRLSMIFAEIDSSHLTSEFAAVQLHAVANMYLEASATLRGLSAPSASASFDDAAAWRDAWSAALSRHVSSFCVPYLYAALSRSQDAARIHSILPEGSPVVWVGAGAGFVPALHAAFKISFDCSPYLYAVPDELASAAPALRLLGVRSAFSSQDFIGLLARLASDMGWAGAGDSVGRELSSAQIELAVIAVQRVSVAISEGSGAAAIDSTDAIWVPDARRGMSLASTCVYDDAPWLEGGTEAVGMSDVATLRFVHPNVSNAVASAVGAMSLRRRLLASHSSLLPMSVPAEAFGQGEPLTRRLRSILEMYPEGAGTLHELTQNADDAGATVVRFMFNLSSYGTTSLLAPSMAPWQGPALIVYNDSLFSAQDWENLSRISQGSKLEKLTTTGRCVRVCGWLGLSSSGRDQFLLFGCIRTLGRTRCSCS
jgi:hypothetical protein